MNHCRCCMYNNFLGVLVLKKNKLTGRVSLPQGRVGKETQNRNKFNAVSSLHTSVHSTPFSPLSLCPVVPPFLLLFSTHLHKASPYTLYPPTHKSPMLLTSLAFLVCASTSALAQQQPQIVYDNAHNATSITGTWSSGSMNVTTGSVRVFVHLQWRLFITGKWCRYTLMQTTRPSVSTPRTRV